MKISIGTLSRSFELSDEAIRFYEKKGLLHPQRVEGNRYRVFEQTDIQRVANIKRLKSQEFSLDEIQRIYSGIGERELAELYDMKIHEMQQDIERRVRLLTHMRRARETLLGADALLVPRIRETAGVYLLEYPSVSDMWQQVGRDEVLKHLFQQLPLSAFTTVIGHTALTGGKAEVSKGILFRAENAEVLQIPLERFRCIGPGRVVSCLFRLENGRFDIASLMKLLNAFLEENHLTVRDDLFTDQLVSWVRADGVAEHYSSMMVPVK